MAAKTQKKTTTTKSWTTSFLNEAETRALDFNLPPNHDPLIRYCKNQIKFLQRRKNLQVRIDHVKNQRTGAKEPEPVVLTDANVWVDHKGEVKYYFDPQEADRCVNWIHRIGRHVFGPQRGQKFRLSHWQVWIVRELFGWRRLGTRFRRYKYLFLFIPRKNGKTLFVALLTLLCLLIDRERGPQIFNIASTGKQSETMFEMAKALCGGTKKVPFRYAHKDLTERTDVLEKNISCPKNGGYIVPLNWNPGAFHGKNPSLLIIEEFHQHDDNTMRSVGEKGMGVRPQPLVILDSTAPERHDSVCGKELALAEKIIDGVLEVPNYLPIVYQAKLDPKRGRTWDSIEVAAECNPQFGLSLTKEFFEDEIRKAKDDPLEELEYKRHQLCLIVDKPSLMTPYHFWRQNKKAFDFRKFVGKPIYMGLDLGDVDDLTALAMVHPGRQPNDYWYAFAQFFCCEYTMKHSRNAALYQTWKDRGYIIVTPGNATDQGYLLDNIVSFSEYFDIRHGKADPWNSGEVMRQLIDEHGLPFSLHRQGSLSMTEPIKLMMSLIRNGRLLHNNPVLDWMFLNTVLKKHSHGLVSLEKVTEDAKIDGMVALAMAIAAALNPENDDEPFESRGPRVI